MNKNVETSILNDGLGCHVFIEDGTFSYEAVISIQDTFSLGNTSWAKNSIKISASEIPDSILSWMEGELEKVNLKWLKMYHQRESVMCSLSLNV